LTTRSTVESPCVSICELNEQDICLGCGRSLDEVGAWLTASEEEKRQILLRAEERRQRQLQQA